jgi:hypothetical protein
MVIYQRIRCQGESRVRSTTTSQANRSKKFELFTTKSDDHGQGNEGAAPAPNHLQTLSIAVQVEAAIHTQSRNDKGAYADKAHSLIFNIKKNEMISFRGKYRRKTLLPCNRNNWLQSKNAKYGNNLSTNYTNHVTWIGNKLMRAKSSTLLVESRETCSRQACSNVGGVRVKKRLVHKIKQGNVQSYSLQTCIYSFIKSLIQWYIHIHP